MWAYKKTMRQRLPPMKYYSEEAPAEEEDATHDVRLEREFRLQDDPDVVVHPADLVKAYKYGPQVRNRSAFLRRGQGFQARAEG